MIALLAALLTPPALGSDGEPVWSEAEALRIAHDLQSFAARNAWEAVEEGYTDLEDLGMPIDADLHELGAEAARNRGDAWTAYQRLVKVLAAGVDPSSGAHGHMATYRDQYGRVVVRRVEITPIALVPETAPFQPDFRLAIAFAAAQLDQEGAFDGLLPAGTYVLGEGRTFEVVPGLTPTVVQREVGDGAQVKKKKKNKD